MGMEGINRFCPEGMRCLVVIRGLTLPLGQDLFKRAGLKRQPPIARLTWSYPIVVREIKSKIVFVECAKQWMGCAALERSQTGIKKPMPDGPVRQLYELGITRKVLSK